MGLMFTRTRGHEALHTAFNTPHTKVLLQLKVQHVHALNPKCSFII